jgi:hypothetical protein
VHLDGCVEVASAYYSVPPRIPLGTRLPVQWDDARVRLLDPHTGQLLCEHRRQGRGLHRIRDEDRPRRTPPSTEQLLARTVTAGPSIGALCAAIHAQDGVVGIRRILGVLALAKQHGVAAVDDACAAALELGVPTYRFARRYLERRAGRAPTLRQIDPLIRQLTHYRDHIDRQTAEQETTE